MKLFRSLGEGLQAGSQAGSRQILGEPYANVRVCGGKFSLQRTVYTHKE